MAYDGGSALIHKCSRDLVRIGKNGAATQTHIALGGHISRNFQSRLKAGRDEMGFTAQAVIKRSFGSVLKSQN